MSKKSIKSIPVLLLVLLLSCSGEGPPDVAADDEILQQGRVIYANNCVGCHGLGGEGGRGKKLADGAVVIAFPDPEGQALVIAEGTRQMPGYASKLTEEEIDAVVKYTREGL